MSFLKRIFRAIRHIYFPKCEVCKNRVSARKIFHFRYYYVDGKPNEEICESCVKYYTETEVKRREYQEQAD